MRLHSEINLHEQLDRLCLTPKQKDKVRDMIENIAYRYSKRLDELEKENEQLKQDKIDFIYMIQDTRKRNLIKENAELKAHCKAVDEVNKKLRCCFNCKNVHYEWREQVQEGICCECRNYNKWEQA